MTFTAHRISADLEAMKPAQPLIVLGVSQQFTVWTLISIELSLAGEEIVALRSRSTFGALPELLEESIPANGNEKVVKAIGILSEDLHRAGPQSVIDRSRDVIAWMLSAYLQSCGQAEVGRDLGRLISRLNGVSDIAKKETAASAANVVRLLHARGKSSEQEKRPMMRSLQEQDAQLAVLCVGMILCDLGWAAWN